MGTFQMGAHRDTTPIHQPPTTPQADRAFGVHVCNQWSENPWSYFNLYILQVRRRGYGGGRVLRGQGGSGCTRKRLRGSRCRFNGGRNARRDRGILNPSISNSKLSWNRSATVIFSWGRVGEQHLNFLLKILNFKQPMRNFWLPNLHTQNKFNSFLSLHGLNTDWTKRAYLNLRLSQYRHLATPNVHRLHSVLENLLQRKLKRHRIYGSIKSLISVLFHSVLPLNLTHTLNLQSSIIKGGFKFLIRVQILSYSVIFSWKVGSSKSSTLYVCALDVMQEQE